MVSSIKLACIAAFLVASIIQGIQGDGFLLPIPFEYDHIKNATFTTCCGMLLILLYFQNVFLKYFLPWLKL
jgi:hypothetical protein